MTLTFFGRLSVCLVLLLVASPAHAQLCRARPSFEVNPYQLDGRAAFTDGGRSLGGDFGVGGRYLFATAGVASRHVTDLDSEETVISTRVGVEVPINRERRIFFCPSGFVSFGTGPDAGPVDVSTFRAGVGGQVGVGVYDSASLMIVPTLGIDVLRERLALEVGGIEEDESDGVASAMLGVGFIINRRIAIVPEFTVPISAADSDVTVGVRVAFGFGGTNPP
jgi:hypothetical protein